MTHYEVLGVEPEATAEEIRTAYRAAARRLHPDHGGDAEKMAALNAAYAVLSDPAKRKQYDLEQEFVPVIEGAERLRKKVTAYAVQEGESILFDLVRTGAKRLRRRLGL